MAVELLEVKNISKAYTGVQALDNVSMSIKKGEVHCLVGENGSGKSTLIKIIAGVVRADEGEIIINGRIYQNLHALDSIREGIQVIYQDLSLYPNLSVAENISLNQMVERKRKFISWREVVNTARRELSNVGKELDLGELVENISMANRQIIAICRALTQGTKLIIMDEPTSALTKSEIDSLLSVILGLKEKGISTLFISHKISEVLEISEKVTILRDGKRVGEYSTDELDNDKLIFLMTGKKITNSSFKYKGKEHDRKVMLEVRSLSKKGNFEDVSFKLHSGEILGVTGLLGSGRTELALSLFGLNKANSGEIYIDGKQVRINSTQDAIKLGISYLPEDRLSQGLFIEQSISNNIIITILRKILNKLKLISSSKREKSIKRWSKELDIKTPSLELAAKSLSGGNQQRVVLAKWLATSPKIFILDCPTKGVDIASKSNIHSIIRSLAKAGMGVIMISDEIPEVLWNCNRILVMSGGRVIEKIDDISRITEDELFNIVGRKELSKVS
ncbi:MAG: sugar ABC transporter ATP-binding protein [Candidatus Humimicrobiaceae bacterium]